MQLGSTGRTRRWESLGTVAAQQTTKMEHTGSLRKWLQWLYHSQGSTELLRTKPSNKCAQPCQHTGEQTGPGCWCSWKPEMPQAQLSRLLLWGGPRRSGPESKSQSTGSQWFPSSSGEVSWACPSHLGFARGRCCCRGRWICWGGRPERWTTSIWHVLVLANGWSSCLLALCCQLKSWAQVSVSEPRK